MRILVLILVLCAIMPMAVTSRISLFRWHDHVRPPVSLERALEISKAKLGDDYENRYCVEVQLFGNPYALPRPGVWNLYFAAEDGSKKHVSVDMDGEATVEMWNEAIDWEKNRGLRHDLEDIRKRFRDFLAKEKLEASTIESNEKTVVSFRQRSFHVHLSNDDGSYQAELSEIAGPDADGFIVEFWVTDTPATPDRQQRAYWTERSKAVPLTSPNTYVQTIFKTGPRLKREYRDQIEQIFGTPDPR